MWKRQKHNYKEGKKYCPSSMSSSSTSSNGFNQLWIKNIRKKNKNIYEKICITTIYMVLGIISNLEMILSIQRDMCRLHEKPMPLKKTNAMILVFVVVVVYV
jgi:cell division protein FtsL